MTELSMTFRKGPATPDWDRRGLPAWTYRSAALLELEKAELFLNHWQLAGHISDAPKPGDYFTFDLDSERALIVRGTDGILRAVNNICRHRGGRVVANAAGNCKNALVCPFHGWVYNLDGSLRGPARPESFGSLDKSKFGLTPLEMDIWLGFIFIRFRPGPQPAVAKWLAPIEPDIAAYRPQELAPASGFWRDDHPVNWKSVRDVDNEGYHVAMAHPGLQDLYGANYVDEVRDDGLSRSFGPYNAHAGRRWSVRNYVTLSPTQEWLPKAKQRSWDYFGLFPNAVFSVAPETVQFYQEFPVTPDHTIMRGAIYRRPEESRQQRLARYLALRIDRETSVEDRQLSVWSNEAMKSAAFSGFHLSDLEHGVRNHHDQLRRRLPVMAQQTAPSENEMAQLNASLKTKLAAR